MAAATDPLGDLQISLPGVLEEFGKLGSNIRDLLEQQPFEHDAVYADHVFQLGSEKVHKNTRFECWSDGVDENARAGPQAAVVSYTDSASQEPSIRTRIAGSVLNEISNLRYVSP